MLEGAMLSKRGMGAFTLNQLEAGIDQLARIAAENWQGLDIIVAFEERGYALYKINDDAEVRNLDDLRPIIEGGRAWCLLELGARYIILPLCAKSDSLLEVSAAVRRMESAGRVPRFIELDSGFDERGGYWTEAIGCFFIDSVVFSSVHGITLVVDPERSAVKDKKRSFPGCEIEIGGDYLLVIKHQITKAVRIVH